jgi:hypothetical protein
MARLNHHDRAVRRSGVVLLIVMAMLALFAVVGLSFVFFAESESDAARYARQLQASDLSDVNPEKLFAYGLGQLIFDTDNPRSKIRGWSLARSIYGSPGGTVPFSGVGRKHPDTTTLPQSITPLPAGQPAVYLSMTPFDGINVPYTYADMNNLFLASLDPDNPGYLKERSFARNGGSLSPFAMRPDGEGEVRNMESIKGVKYSNPNGGASGDRYNDAFWMDLDFPILTSKDGTRFKPLFAFTVLDLDGRVNLAASGNYQADYNTQGATTSRLGLGTFEINPAKVLTVRTEVANLFRGNNGVTGRWGGNNLPDRQVLFAPIKQPYGKIDYSGVSTSNLSAPPPFSQFPTNNWADPGQAPAAHAASLDYLTVRYAQNGDDSRMAVSNAEGLLRWRDRGSHALTSELYRLFPDSLNMRSNGPQSVNLVTPHSMSFDTPHLVPFFPTRPVDGNGPYTLQQGNPYPKVDQTTKTSPNPQTALAGTGFDFGPEFRSRVAGELRRLNLNRGMYVAQDRQIMAKDIFDRLVRVTGAMPPNPTSQTFQQGAGQRNDPIYNATRWLAQLAVNMVDFMDEETDFWGSTMTVFNWNPKVDPASNEKEDFVFGTELNRLLINEVYASIDNDKDDQGILNPNDPKQLNATKYRVNVWAELYNPMSVAVAPFSGSALLVSNTSTPRYRLILAEDATGIDKDSTGMPQKIMNDTDALNPNKVGVTDWSMTVNGNTKYDMVTVSPGDQSRMGTGFYLIGPKDDYCVSGSAITWDSTKLQWQKSAGMSSKSYTMPGGQTPTAPNNKTVTVVLQRLADMNRDEQPDPKQVNPPYNPYITVDYFPNVPANDHLAYVGSNKPSPKIGNFKSIGRLQPLQASSPLLQDPEAAQPPQPAIDSMGKEPQHTFNVQNGSKQGQQNPNFKPLYHVDRPLTSAAEILSASAYAPSQLTQRFPNFSSMEIVKDVNSLLFRFLETVTVGDLMYNAQLANYNQQQLQQLQARIAQNPNLFGANSNPPPGSPYAGTFQNSILVPGKINLCTVPDEKVLQALFDAQEGSSFFTKDDVSKFWTDLKTVRSTRAIAGFSDYTTTDGGANQLQVQLLNTMFQDQNQQPQLFGKMMQASQASAEYEKAEALRKVMNNITFTSNVFAVWLTVGFFEVDPATNNVVQEIGKAENRQVRHRMFAIVDRSQLVIPDSAQPVTTLASPITKNVSVSLTVGTTSYALNSVNAPAKVEYLPNATGTIKAGTMLTIDKDYRDPVTGQLLEETVMVTVANGNQLRINGPFLQSHRAGATVHLAGIRGPLVPINAAAANANAAGNTNVSYMLGYPGPQPNFNLREYTYVVPFYSIID